QIPHGESQLSIAGSRDLVSLAVGPRSIAGGVTSEAQTPYFTGMSGRKGGRLPGRAGPFVGRDLLVMAKGDRDVVETLQKPPAGVVVDLETLGNGVLAVPRQHQAAFQIDRH